MICYQNTNKTKFIRIDDFPQFKKQIITVVSFGSTPLVKIYDTSVAGCMIPFGDCITCEQKDFDLALEAADDIMLSTQKLLV